MMRSVWAVLSGFIFIGVLAAGTTQIMHAISPWAFDSFGGTQNVAILLLTIAYSSVYGVVGCYLTARLAPSRPMAHALAQGVVGIVISILSLVVGRGHFPMWFLVLNIILMMPLAWFGGRLRTTEMIMATPNQAGAPA